MSNSTKQFTNHWFLAYIQQNNSKKQWFYAESQNNMKFSILCQFRNQYLYNAFLPCLCLSLIFIRPFDIAGFSLPLVLKWMMQAQWNGMDKQENYEFLDNLNWLKVKISHPPSLLLTRCHTCILVILMVIARRRLVRNLTNLI